jgi:hypothetical protein
LDAILKVAAAAFLVFTLPWAVVVLAAGLLPNDDRWQVLWLAAAALFLVVAAWWSPRNPRALADWLNRRRGRVPPRRRPRTTKPRRAATSKIRGRPPKPSTMALRQRMDEDKANGRLAAPRDYCDFLRSIEPGIRNASAEQIVTRELKRRRG